MPSQFLQAGNLEAVNKWRGDKFSECHYSDTIWGNAIRTVEYLEVSGGASKFLFIHK